MKSLNLTTPKISTLFDGSKITLLNQNCGFLKFFAANSFCEIRYGQFQFGNTNYIQSIPRSHLYTFRLSRLLI